VAVAQAEAEAVEQAESVVEVWVPVLRPVVEAVEGPHPFAPG